MSLKILFYQNVLRVLGAEVSRQHLLKYILRKLLTYGLVWLDCHILKDLLACFLLGN